MINAPSNASDSYQFGRPGEPLLEATITVRTMPKKLRSSSTPRSSGYASSEFRLAWIVPMAAAILAALLEWADKLPAWAQSPVVLSAAMFCGALIVCAYIVSRGLAKVEVRGDPSPGDPRPGEPF